MNLINAKHGSEPGLKARTHVSDLFAPHTIPATVNEAPTSSTACRGTRSDRRSRSNMPTRAASQITYAPSPHCCRIGSSPASVSARQDASPSSIRLPRQRKYVA